MGTWVPRFSRGINKQHYSIESVHHRYRGTIQKYISGVEHCFRDYGDKKERSMIREASKLINPSLFSIPRSTQKKKSNRPDRRVSSVYGALAAGKMSI